MVIIRHPRYRTGKHGLFTPVFTRKTARHFPMIAATSFWKAADRKSVV
jgi:hypothetical protein